jgi:hypothetical protein
LIEGKINRKKDLSKLCCAYFLHLSEKVYFAKQNNPVTVVMKRLIRILSVLFFLMGLYLLFSFLLAEADVATGVGGVSFLTLSLGLLLSSFMPFLKE